MTPAEAYVAGEPGFYVVDVDGSAVGGPFERRLSARNVAQALDSQPGTGRFVVVFSETPVEVPA